MSETFKQKVICVLRAPQQEIAYSMAQTCIEAGLQNIEVTFTTPGAADIIKKLKADNSQAIVGCGSVSTLDQAKRARDAGADFFISPHFDKELSQWFVNEKLLYIPGGLTPTELASISRAGHEYQKLFPAQIYGPSGVKGVLQPMPFLSLLVTGGVSLDTATDFLDAGAQYVCVGSKLFTNEIIKSKDFSALKTEALAWMEINKHG